MMNSSKIFTSNKSEDKHHIFFPLMIGFLSMIIAVIAIWNIAVTEIEYKVAASEYSELYDSMPFGEKPFSSADLRSQRNSEAIVKGERKTKSLDLRMTHMEVAFRLSQIANSYNDIIGWIDFETLPISYPLMHGETNDDYLRTTFKGTKATAGSIFMESLNNADFSDLHTIIYGHNMKDGSMFGQLKKYGSLEFLESNRNFTIYTPDGDVFEYEIISCMVVPLDSFVYKVGFADESEYEIFLSLMGYKQADMPQSITLSTCAGADKSYRLVVNAVRVQAES